jgi:hypothetical protein
LRERLLSIYTLPVVQRYSTMSCQLQKII